MRLRLFSPVNAAGMRPDFVEMPGRNNLLWRLQYEGIGTPAPGRNGSASSSHSGGRISPPSASGQEDPVLWPVTGPQL